MFDNPGPTPQMANAATVTQPLSSPIAPSGPCPATGGLAQRVLTTPVSFTPGNAANFFAGIRNTGFAGLDTTPPNDNRIWLTCAVCVMTIYSPADLNGLGLGGNWLIRVTVEDASAPSSCSTSRSATSRPLLLRSDGRRLPCLPLTSRASRVRFWRRGQEIPHGA